MISSSKPAAPSDARRTPEYRTERQTRAEQNPTENCNEIQRNAGGEASENSSKIQPKLGDATGGRTSAKIHRKIRGANSGQHTGETTTIARQIARGTNSGDPEGAGDSRAANSPRRPKIERVDGSRYFRPKSRVGGRGMFAVRKVGAGS